MRKSHVYVRPKDNVTNLTQSALKSQMIRLEHIWTPCLGTCI